MPTIQIADKPTLDTVKTNTDTTNTKIGNTADSGASASTGSVNGKLNKIITDASTNMGYVMASETLSITPSTASVTPTGSGTKVQKIGSFSFTHTGKARVVVLAKLSAAGTGTVQFYCSTYSTTSPSVSNLDDNNKGKSVQAYLTKVVNNVFYIDTSELTANTTYYIHAVVTTSTVTPAWTFDITFIDAGLSYATSTPCSTVVKSVQSGYSLSSSITINPVVVEKSIVIINDIKMRDGTSWDDHYPYTTGVLLTCNKLFLLYVGDNTNSTVPATSGDPVSWQVIEFY